MYFTRYLPGKCHIIYEYSREIVLHNPHNRYWLPFTSTLQQFMAQGFQNQNRMGLFNAIWNLSRG